MRAGAGLLSALLALASAGGAAAQTSSAEPPPPALRLLLPGRLAEATVVPAGDRDLLAVVLRERAPEGTPRDESDGEAEGETRRRLYLYDPAARTLVPGAEPLPEGAPDLAAGAGGSVWVGLVRFGEVAVLPARGGPAAADGGEPATLGLPRRAERTPWGLRLTSPEVHTLADPAADPGGPPCFATAPEAHGRRRLRVLLLCPGREPEEVWALLPGAETVTESRFGLLAGAPALAILTREKLGLFVKQELRVFPLSGSRSRVGGGPVLAARTDCPLWRGSELSFTDADGDGARDVVVVCRTGLVDPELRVEVYRQRGAGERGGPFERRPRVAKLDGDFGTWHYGEDWTGDGVPDLLVTRGNLLHVYPGDPRGRPVDGRPSRSLALPGAADGEDAEHPAQVTVGTPGAEVREWLGGPTLVAAGDLDGDGRPEVVVHRARKDGGELLVLTP